jgi:predicted PurR-regulated permease PerM
VSTLASWSTGSAIASHIEATGVKPAEAPLDQERICRKSISAMETDVTAASKDRILARNDLAWAIAVGGILIVLFAALLWFAWRYVDTLFLVFAGVLFGVALNAMTVLLGRFIRLPQLLRLTIVCLTLVALFSGVLVLGGTTIASQASALSNTIKSQLVTVKSFLEKNGVDTSYFDLGDKGDKNDTSGDSGGPLSHLPNVGTLASGGSAIIGQTLKVLLGTVSVVGNFFIILFLGLCLAAQPGVYRSGLVFFAPARHRARATAIIDRIGETLERWLLAQMLTMLVVFAVTSIGLAIIGIPSSLILGIQAGLLAFIPTIGALIGGLIVVLASLASGWVLTLSAFILFLGVHVLESYVLTPVIQRQALDIPPATLFAFQILLGVAFGLWGLALALPLIAIAKVIIDCFKEEEPLAPA